MQNEAPKTCALCGKDLGQIPPDAPHKKFCCVEHRVKFWREARKVGADALRAAAKAAA